MFKQASQGKSWKSSKEMEIQDISENHGHWVKAFGVAVFFTNEMKTHRLLSPRDSPSAAFLICNAFLFHLYQFRLDLCFKAQLECYPLTGPSSIFPSLEHLKQLQNVHFSACMLLYFSTLVNKYYFSFNQSVPHSPFNC